MRSATWIAPRIIHPGGLEAFEGFVYEYSRGLEADLNDLNASIALLMSTMNIEKEENDLVAY